MTGSDPRAALAALIKYLGLSQREAASLLGIGEMALSRKLAGADRYDVREKEIDILRQLADVVDIMVDKACEHIYEFRKRAMAENAGVDVELLVYRKDKDLPQWVDLPFSSVHMQAMSRISRTAGAALVMFDAVDYSSWLCGRPDTQAARADWAAGYRRERLRFAFSLGGKTGISGQSTLGWAALKAPPRTDKIDGGIVYFPDVSKGD